MRRPQLFHKRRCYSSQAKPSCAAQSRAATLRCGIGLQVGNSRRLGHLQRTASPSIARAPCAKGLPGYLRYPAEHDVRVKTNYLAGENQV